MTWFQVENDFVAQLIKRQDEANKASLGLAPQPTNNDPPTLDDWREAMAKSHPEWTEQQVRDDWADLLEKWNEGE